MLRSLVTRTVCVSVILFIFVPALGAPETSSIHELIFLILSITILLYLNVSPFERWEYHQLPCER